MRYVAYKTEQFADQKYLLCIFMFISNLELKIQKCFKLSKSRNSPIPNNDNFLTFLFIPIHVSVQFIDKQTWLF